MSKIVNFFGAPNSGKSLRAAETYSALKKGRYNAELVREYAKDKVYEKNNIAINCEPYIMGHELYNIEKLIQSGVEYIVTDCPILIPSFYNKTRSKTFELFALELFSTFNNINFFLKVDVDNFEQNGRIHNLEESLKMEKKMLNFLDYYEIPYSFIEYNDNIDSEFLTNKNITLSKFKSELVEKLFTAKQPSEQIRYGRRGTGEYDT